MLATFDKFHQLLVYRRMLEMSLAFWPCCWNAWCYCWWLLAVRETWSWSSNLAKSTTDTTVKNWGQPQRQSVSQFHMKLFFFSWISKDNLRKLSSSTWKPKLTSIVGHASKLRKLVEDKVTGSQPKEAGENGWNMADSVVFQHIGSNDFRINLNRVWWERSILNYFRLFWVLFWLACTVFCNFLASRLVRSWPFGTSRCG